MSTLDRLQKLAELRGRIAESQQLNRKEVVAEHSRLKTHPAFLKKQERKKREAEILLEKRQLTEQGMDPERSRWKEYTAEEAEAYEEKQAKKQKTVDLGHATFDEKSQRKYEKLTDRLQVDLNDYEESKEEELQTKGDLHEFYALPVDQSNHVQSVDHYPSDEEIERMKKDLSKQLEVRANTSRRRRYDPNAPVVFVNERNRKFNEKITRYFDKFTEEVRENLERGTAL